MPSLPLCAADTGRPKGFGFIEFLDRRDGEEAIYNLDRTMFGNREIQVGAGCVDRGLLSLRNAAWGFGSLGRTMFGSRKIQVGAARLHLRCFGWGAGRLRLRCFGWGAGRLRYVAFGGVLAGCASQPVARQRNDPSLSAPCRFRCA